MKVTQKPKNHRLIRTLILSFFTLFVFKNTNLVAQCNTTVTPIDYCAGQYAEFDVDNIDATATYNWFDVTGVIPYNGNSHFVSPTTIPGGSGIQTFQVQKEDRVTMGNYAGGFADANPTANNNLVSVNSTTDLTLNSVTVAVKKYNNWSGSFSLQVFVGGLGTGTTIQNFTYDMGGTPAGATKVGDYFVVTLPVGLDITSGAATNVWVAGTDVDQWGRFNGGSPYADNNADYGINVTSTSSAVGLHNLDFTAKCSLVASSASETAVGCCTPIATAPTITAPDSIIVTPFGGANLVASGNATHYYEWFLDGVSLGGGVGQQTQSYTTTGVYTVRVAESAADIGKFSCYKASDQLVQERSLFATPKVTTVCIGEKVDVSATGAVKNVVWSPTVTVADPSSATTSITPVSPGTATYTVEADVIGGDLIVNGNFDAGNTGFTSDMSQQANPGSGSYNIGTSVDQNNSFWMPCTDHTTGSSNLFFADPSTSPGTVVWEQTVPVAQNNDYTFSAWATNISGNANPPSASVPDTPAELIVLINGVQVGGTHPTSGNVCDWTQMERVWNSGGSSTATIQIFVDNAAGTAAGKDFGLDDIQFGGPQRQSDQITITVRPPEDCFTITAVESAPCDANNKVELTATTTGIFDSWVEVGGGVASIDSPNDETTLVTPPATNTGYAACASFQLGNLLTNGDFELGNQQFSSDYGYRTSVNDVAQYSVGTNPVGQRGMISMTDHTSGTGLMYYSDGGSNPNDRIYYNTVNVEMGKDYAFSAWLANVHQEFLKAVPDTVNNAKTTNLEFVINGMALGVIKLDINTQWQQFSTIWTSTINGPVVIEIRNRETALVGNDFVMDDLVFAPLFDEQICDTVYVDPCTPPCDKPASVDAGSDIDICVGANGTLSGSFVDGLVAAPLTGMSYVWYKQGTTPVAGDYAAVSGPIPNFPITGAGLTDGGTYVLRVEDGTVGDANCYTEGTVDVAVHEVPDITVTDPTAVCSPSTVDITGTWVDGNTTGGTVTYHSATPATAGNAITNAGAIPTTGTYHVQIDNSGCTDEAPISVTVNPLPNAPVVGVIPEFCFGVDALTVGTAINTAITSTGTLTFYEGVTVIPNLALRLATLIGSTGNTTFSVTQTVNGCESAGTDFTIVINELPTATLEPGGTFCTEDLGTESLTVTVNGGTGGYTVYYTFDNGANGTVGITTGTTGSIDNTVGADLGVGTYTLDSIRDAKGCIGIITGETAVIDVHPDLAVVPVESCNFGTQTASISATISGGVPGGYAVSAESPGTGAIVGTTYTMTDFSSTASTNYTYTISDGTGCTNNSITITDDIDCGCTLTGALSLATGSSLTLCPGENTLLEVTPSGSVLPAPTYVVTLSGPVTGTNPAGDYTATTVTGLGVHQFELNVAGTYTIKSIDDGTCAGVGTGSETITVLEAPSFDRDLSTTPVILCPGEALNLDVTALGSPEVGNTALTYVWTAPNGETSTTNSLSIASVVEANEGNYSVEVTGACGTVTSGTTPVTVNEDVAITTDLDPTALNLCPGDALNLNVVATGTPEAGNTDLTYVWTAPNGETSTTNGLAIASVVTASTGDYSVSVTGACGTVTSTVTPVNVGVETAITVQPSLADANLCPGEDFTLDVTAVGDNLTYQWQKDGVDTVGATSSSLTITGVNASNAGAYRVIVSGTCDPGTPKTPITSAEVNISVGVTTIITDEPDDAQACALSNAIFDVTAVGSGTLTYQWYRGATPLTNGGNITGDTTASLGIDPTAVGDAGDYTVIVTGECGAVTSRVARLDITTTEFPSVTITVDNTTICEGEDVTYTAIGGATGTMPLYEFRRSGTSTVLQPQGPSNTYTTTGGLIANDTVTVIMTSNSLCVDPTADNPVRDSTSVVVITPSVATITVPATDTHYVAQDDITLETVNPGAGYNVEWQKITGSQQGTLVSPLSTTTDLTGLTTIEPDPETGVGTTDIVLIVKDNGDVCPSATDTVKVIRKNITQPVIIGAELCINEDLPHTVRGNNVIPVFETPTLIDVNDLRGLGNNTSLGGTTFEITNPAFTESTKDFKVIYQIANSLSGTLLKDSAIFKIHNAPTTSVAGPDQTTCAGSVTLAGNTPTIGTGEWTCTGGVTITDATSPNAQVSGLVNNTPVTCTWTISNGTCDASQSSMQITKVGDVTTPSIYLDNVDVTGQDVDICISDVVNLRGEAPVAPETGLWATPSGTSITGVAGIAADQGALTIAGSGATRLEWTISSPVPNCNPETRFVNLIVHEEPVADITNVLSTDTCAGIDITASTAPIGATDMATWTSTIVPATTGTDSWNIVSTNLLVGNNVITYEVDNAGCDPATDTETITIEGITNTGVTINTLGTLCEGVTADYIATPTGGGLNPSYVWTYTEDPSITGTTSLNTLSLTNVQESIGTVTVEMISSVRCVDNPSVTATTILTVVPGPQPEVLTSDTTICVTSPIVIEGRDNSTAGQPTTYQWYRDGIIPVGDGSFILSGVNVSGTYTLQADNGICAALTSTTNVVVDVRQVPVVDASANGVNPVIGDFDENIQLEGSSSVSTVTWTINTTDVTITNPTDLSTPATAVDGGQFTATLTATDGPCIASDIVGLLLTSPILAPNVFTPNGDGYFETFSIKGVETYPGAIVTIFNRWGHRVYESDDYTSNEWDASNVPDGVYYFVVRTGLEGDEGHSGVIHVVR